jgi:soluble lytic murein transglycosylase-like protein
MIAAGIIAGGVGMSAAYAGGLADCFNRAGEMYGVSPNLLSAIALTESSYNQTAHNVNSDGSEDLGLMQINSWWLSALAPYHIGRERLLSDGCLNIHVGAWILKQEIQRLGPTWRAVGAYNAKSPDKARRYAAQVYRAYRSHGGNAALEASRNSVPVSSPVQPRYRRPGQ